MALPFANIIVKSGSKTKIVRDLFSPPRADLILKRIKVHSKKWCLLGAHLSACISQKHTKPYTDLYSSSRTVKLNVICERCVLNILLSTKLQKKIIIIK